MAAKDEHTTGAGLSDKLIHDLVLERVVLEMITKQPEPYVALADPYHVDRFGAILLEILVHDSEVVARRVQAVEVEHEGTG